MMGKTLAKLLNRITIMLANSDFPTTFSVEEVARTSRSLMPGIAAWTWRRLNHFSFTWMASQLNRIWKRERGRTKIGPQINFHTKAGPEFVGNWIPLWQNTRTFDQNSVRPEALQQKKYKRFNKNTMIQSLASWFLSEANVSQIAVVIDLARRSWLPLTGWSRFLSVVFLCTDVNSFEFSYLLEADLWLSNESFDLEAI